MKLCITCVACFVVICLSQGVKGGPGVFLEKEKASEFLKREKRANTGFEEFSQGNFEQECLEEQCNYEETREVFEDDAVATEKYASLTDQCSTIANECSVPGTEQCVNYYNSHACVCRSGYTGDKCQTDIDECSDNPCVNGVCIDEPGTFTCLCPSGYTGQLCNEDVNECAKWSGLCQNNGTCMNSMGAYWCLCAVGWTGSDCANDINECEENNPCVNGECVNDFGSFTCTCNTGYGGTLCDEDTDECALGHCPEGSECQDGINSFTCVCPSEGCSGYTDAMQQQESP